MNPFDVAGKVAVVTGGAKGIGAATSRMLEQAGAKVAVFDTQAAGSANVDVTHESAVKDAVARVADEHGGIDILVNSAGRAARKPATELTVEEWREVIDLNLTAMFVCSRTVHPYMKARGGGSIVNLASIMGLSGGIFPNASYQASKGGVVNLTRALALEWAPDNIRVNAVAPTFVSTDLTVPVFTNAKILQTVMDHTPLGRLPDVDDIAAAVLYLCSSSARCITGIVLPVDSGFLAR
jgi:NAD(P)-dependent dehydrogenase (short-subunit alcohol dehydrogenase family)